MKLYKFRYVNEIAGVFVFLSFFLVIAVFIAAGFIQGRFETKVFYHTLFSTKDGTYGLQKGCETRILSTQAGSVLRILPNENGQIEALFEIKKSFQKFVRTDSRVVVKKKFGVAGDAYLEIIPGDPKKHKLPEMSVIPCSKESEVMETLKDVLQNLQNSFNPVMKKLEESLDQIPPMLEQITKTFAVAEGYIVSLKENTIPPLQKTTALMNDLSVVLKIFEATLIKTDNLAKGLTEDSIPMIREFRDVIQELKKVILNFQNFTNMLQDQKIQIFLEDLPGLTLRLEEALAETKKVFNGIEKHWLIKKYIPQTSENKDSEKLNAEAKLE